MEYLNHLLPEKLKDELQIAWTPVGIDADVSILSEGDKERYHTFKSDERKQEFIAGRYLAKKLAEKMHLNPENLQISHEEDGKPIANYHDHSYYISLSHSDGQVMCALSNDVAIGIDIEPASRQITTELRERIMGEYEVQTLQGVNTLRIWTMKEALMKLYGKRLGSSLRECVINHSDSDIYEAEVSDQEKADVFSDKHDKYWLAVAW